LLDSLLQEIDNGKYEYIYYCYKQKD